jgi:HEAT repeat protein
LLDAVDDEDHGVRVEAVAALRTRVTPETTAALLGALADDSPAVASRALIVLRKRHFEGIADPTLVEHARAGRYNAQIDRSMASALVGHREDAEVRVALAAIAERTTDRELAAALRTTLEDA